MEKVLYTLSCVLTVLIYYGTSFASGLESILQDRNSLFDRRTSGNGIGIEENLEIARHEIQDEEPGTYIFAPHQKKDRLNLLFVDGSGIVQKKEVSFSKDKLKFQGDSYFTSRKTLDSFLKKHQEKLKSPMQMYDRQLILDLGSGNSAKGLTLKTRSQGLRSETHSLKVDYRQTDLSHIYRGVDRLSGRSRVYIIGHSAPGSDSIESDEINGQRFKWTYKDLAGILAKNNDLKNIKEPVTISLVACEAGSDGKAGQESFAKKLGEELLSKYNVPSRIYARTGKVSRFNGQGEFHKKVDGESKSKKVELLTTKEGTTTKNVYPKPSSEDCESDFGPFPSSVPIFESVEEIAKSLKLSDQSTRSTKTQKEELKPSQIIAGSEAAGIEKLRYLPPGSIALWPISNDMGEFGLAYKTFDSGAIQVLPVLSVESLETLGRDFVAVSDYDSAKEKMTSAKTGTTLIWKSSRRNGGFGVWQKTAEGRVLEPFRIGYEAWRE